MKRLIWGLVLTCLLPGLAQGQSSDEHHAQGYAFFAPGASSPGGTGTMHMGVGGEGLFYKGLGAGAEVGYLAPWSSFRDGFGIGSANGYYQFGPSRKDRKLIPFVTGGYSLFFRQGTSNAFNVGGGVNYWFRDHLGLRLEVRDHINTEVGTAHFVGFRVALAFR